MKRKYEVMPCEPYWHVGYGPNGPVELVNLAGMITCAEFISVARCWSKKRAEQIAKLLNEADEPEEAAVPVTASGGRIEMIDGKTWWVNESRTEGKSGSPSELP